MATIYVTNMLGDELLDPLAGPLTVRELRERIQQLDLTPEPGACPAFVVGEIQFWSDDEEIGADLDMHEEVKLTLVWMLDAIVTKRRELEGYKMQLSMATEAVRTSEPQDEDHHRKIKDRDALLRLVLLASRRLTIARWWDYAARTLKSAGRSTVNCAQITSSALELAFDLFAREDPTAIAHEDLRCVVMDLGERPDVDELKRMILLADKNKDGKVNALEFGEILRESGLCADISEDPISQQYMKHGLEANDIGTSPIASPINLHQVKTTDTDTDPPNLSLYAGPDRPSMQPNLQRIDPPDLPL